jgi:hypothetical protein
MDKFKIVYDLERLSEEERQRYAREASAYFGLDPDLNGLDFIWMNSGDGLRKLVLYARRGVADILREKLDITIESLSQAVIQGSLVTTAAGRNKNNRKEIAVGSCFIEGLKGKALDNAIMTSQTRALRRLTLQFIGGGILDESEVNAATTNIVYQDTPLPELASKSSAASDASDEIKSKKHPNRKSKIDVDFSESQFTAPVPSASFVSVTTPAIPASLSPTSVTSPAIPASPSPVFASSTANSSKLNLEQVKPFRQRLFKLLEKLEAAGFAPKEGMGNIDKMRMLVTIMFPNVTNMNELTAENWEKYLTTLEKMMQKEGTAATIKYIESVTGI